MDIPLPLLSAAESPVEAVAHLVLLLSVIILAAKLAGEIVERVASLPAVLGELGAGILIGPFALGGIEIWSLGPFFEIPTTLNEAGEAIDSITTVAPELFFVAQVAAIILLFQAGLETNRAQFFRWVRPATAVAAGGVIVPFAFGFGATVFMGFASFDSTHDLLPALFVGAIMTATSVGITARVLADVRRLDTPEGTTIMAGAVVDDVLGILILAVVIGIADTGEVSVGEIGIIAAKAIGFWLGLMIIGSMLANRISNALLWFRSPGVLVGLALFLALLASAIAEIYFGLAMIIGAYTMGLALSDTELKHRIEEPMIQIGHFVVPVFFVVIGMQVDLGAMSGAILFGLALSGLGILSKLIGAGLPALAVGFNSRGAWRVAIGMLPRGEVALIIAGIGLSSEVIGQDVFGVAILMTIVTTLVAPIILVPAFMSGGSGLRRPMQGAPAHRARGRPGRE
ncbi:MAG: cation:proton antiporter [Dehalococcoidia bacterium]|jgi:Kef-type K+ transport system membrane component KefB|nr:cation:proton antiporter [Dehalococcoidia bacterium]